MSSNVPYSFYLHVNLTRRSKFKATDPSKITHFRKSNRGALNRRDCLFLGAFAKLRKRLLVSPCLSVCMEELGPIRLIRIIFDI